MSLRPQQQQMVEFESHWYQFGGGPSEQIRERFGMPVRDFFAELNTIVDEEPPSSLAPNDIERMRGVIRRRLWLAS
jgi:hypothetical protein